MSSAQEQKHNFDANFKIVSIQKINHENIENYAQWERNNFKKWIKPHQILNS